MIIGLNTIFTITNRITAWHANIEPAWEFLDAAKHALARLMLVWEEGAPYKREKP